MQQARTTIQNLSSDNLRQASDKLIAIVYRGANNPISLIIIIRLRIGFANFHYMSTIVFNILCAGILLLKLIMPINFYKDHSELFVLLIEKEPIILSIKTVCLVIC